jgi:predicted DNA-binding transcriptional regulator AlpA
MELPESLQHLIPIANNMGVALYQRFSETDAATFLNIPLESLALIRGQNKISFIQLDSNHIEFFGYQLIEFLIGSVTQANTTQAQSVTSDRMIRTAELTKMVGMSRTTIWRMEKSGEFPARVSLGAGSIAWRLSEINQWIQSREIN